MKLHCPFCGGDAYRTPFLRSFGEDEDASKDDGGAMIMWYYGPDPEFYDGAIERWTCEANKEHVFYPSFEAESQKKLANTCSIGDCTGPVVFHLRVQNDKNPEDYRDVPMCAECETLVKAKEGANIKPIPRRSRKAG